METSSSGSEARRTSLNPQLLPTPNTLFSLGRRKSPSINRTLRPISATAMLRLQATVVLPSPGHGLVITMTCGPFPSSVGNRIEVSVVRAHSATIDGLRFQVASSGPSDFQARRVGVGLLGCNPLEICRGTAVSSSGITPNSGKSRKTCASPGALILRLTRSRTKTKPKPKSAPPHKPIAEFIGKLVL